MSKAPTTPRRDGRHARKDRTREAIVSALLALLDEGALEPTAAQIAARAQVAVRSIAQHFRTREQLMLAVAARHAARLPEPEAPGAAAPFARRLDAFVAARAQELEASRAVRHAAQLGAARSPSIAGALRDVGRRRGEALRRALGPELARADADVRHAAVVLASAATWDALRAEQGLAPRAAARVVRSSLGRLLGRGGRAG